MDKEISDFINSIKIEGVTIGPLLKKEPSTSEENWDKQVKAHREKFLSEQRLHLPLLKIVEEEEKDN